MRCLQWFGCLHRCGQTCPFEVNEVFQMMLSISSPRKCAFADRKKAEADRSFELFELSCMRILHVLLSLAMTATRKVLLLTPRQYPTKHLCKLTLVGRRAHPSGNSPRPPAERRVELSVRPCFRPCGPPQTALRSRNPTPRGFPGCGLPSESLLPPPPPPRNAPGHRPILFCFCFGNLKPALGPLLGPLRMLHPALGQPGCRGGAHGFTISSHCFLPSSNFECWGLQHQSTIVYSRFLTMS